MDAVVLFLQNHPKSFDLHHKTGEVLLIRTRNALILSSIFIETVDGNAIITSLGYTNLTKQLSKHTHTDLIAYIDTTSRYQKVLNYVYRHRGYKQIETELEPGRGFQSNMKPQSK